MQKTTLGLKLPTDPRWANMANMELQEILTDHAYCEQKAASTCITLIQSYPERKKMVREIAPIVTEEWGHFRQVLAEMDKRGLELGPQRKDLYVNAIFKWQRKGGSPDDRLLEKLLTSALIEARSCERFRLLSMHIADDDLKEFYHKFMVSEAGHYRLFLDLAHYYTQDEEKVNNRWQEYLDFEAELMKELEVRPDRIH